METPQDSSENSILSRSASEREGNEIISEAPVLNAIQCVCAFSACLSFIHCISIVIM